MAKLLDLLSRKLLKLGMFMKLFTSFATQFFKFLCCNFFTSRDGICTLLRGPGNDSKESIPPAYMARRGGTTTLFLFGS